MNDTTVSLVVYAVAIVFGGIGAGAAIGLLSRTKTEPPPLLEIPERYKVPPAQDTTDDVITADERPSGKRGPR